MGELDIDALLQNGYWPNSRARSPDPRAIESPQRSNYSSQPDLTVPRKLLALHVRPSRPLPPPPSTVEDEEDAATKEHDYHQHVYSSEEPKNKGEIDQQTLIEDVFEENPERRFVIVQNKDSESSGETSGSEARPKVRPHKPREIPPKKAPEPRPDVEVDSAPYEANTCRKYVQVPSRDEPPARKETRLDRDREHDNRRRSRLENLPPIVTDSKAEERPYDSRRAKSTSRRNSRGPDYFSPQTAPSGPRLPRDGLLTPEVIEHATNGRDRPYYKGGSNLASQGRNRSVHPNDQYSRTPAADRASAEKPSKPAHPTSPTFQKRHTVDLPKYTRRDSKEASESRPYVQVSPTKPEHRAPASVHIYPGRDTTPQPSPRPREKRDGQRREHVSSSEDEKRSDGASRRRQSALPPRKPEYLNPAAELRPADPRQSRGPSPAAAPRPSQNSGSDQSASSSPRSSTFPRELKPREDRNERPLSRASTARGAFTVPETNIIPGVAAGTAAAMAVPSSTAGRPMPPPPRASTIATPRPSASLSTSTPTRPAWAPPKFEPSRNGISSGQPISSYRRYSLEVKQGELPDIPPCPRTREEAGHMDWLTLPRCDNFNICPSCYGANFSTTEFAHHFVPVPFRPRDRPLACDFGTSEYYRIAWLFTRKYGKPDLGLLFSLTQIAAKSQPCTGHREASRIWYSIKDPRAKRPVDDFTVCHACAKTVETLLPSLTGLFVPLDSPAEPSRGICAMHQDRGHDRGRFLLYFDVLEGAADRALETQSAPNVQALADRIRELAAVPPCPEGRPLRNALWHTMRSAPDLIVCPECFMIVVRPLLDARREDLTVVGDFFHQPTRMTHGDCMLYSDRMRSIFDRAVRRRDIAYLAAKARERNDKERECTDQLKVLQRQGLSPAAAEAEAKRIKNEWRKWE
ncbi:hypothetical protein F5Y18DRAFT_397189 [Xylariaceae sp. FL1019]|nr:hypothetical protein F5Y18DRAFT_397189 [Xylariaceae sp. FL1019]